VGPDGDQQWGLPCRGRASVGERSGRTCLPLPWAVGGGRPREHSFRQRHVRMEKSARLRVLGYTFREKKMREENGPTKASTGDHSRP
jgi:hypothetical protein